MSKSTVKVLVACGSGVATSTVAQAAVKEIAERASVPVQIFKGTIGEVGVKQYDVDIVCTTTNYRKPLERPFLSVFPLISGINKDKCESDLTELLKKVQAE